MESFGISEVNITGRENKRPADLMPDCNPQRRSSPDAQVRRQQANREAPAALLGVRTRPKCPEDNLRELR